MFTSPPLSGSEVSFAIFASFCKTKPFTDFLFGVRQHDSALDFLDGVCWVERFTIFNPLDGSIQKVQSVSAKRTPNAVNGYQAGDYISGGVVVCRWQPRPTAGYWL